MFSGGVQQEARLGFAAIAGIRVVVITDLKRVQWKAISKIIVHRFDNGPILGSTSYVRLIRDNTQPEASLPKHLQSRLHAREYFKVVKSRGRERLSVAHDSAIYNAIPVEENSFTRRRVYRTDSHLVSTCLSKGCETSRCHTMA